MRTLEVPAGRSNAEKFDPIQPKPIEGKIEPYPSTILGILKRLRCLVYENKLREIQNENGNVVPALLTILEEGTIKFQKWAEEHGKSWKGKVECNYFPREQDGAAFSSGWGIEIGEKKLLIFEYTSERVYSRHIDQKERIESSVSPDFKQLFSVLYTNTKNFDGQTQVIESINIKFKKNRLSEFSFVEQTEIPTGLGSFYVKPSGPIRELKVKFPL